MEKKLTAMQELIEYLEKYKEVIGITAVMTIDKAQSLLPKEREQIEEAYNDGYIDGSAELSEGVHPQYKSASDYFTQTYQAQY